MQLGIDKTLSVVSELTTLAVDAIGLVKAGGGLGTILKVLKIAGDVKDLLADVPEALPELKDIDQAEAGKLATASYGLVVAVITAMKA